jgi:hypothetical protein
MISAEYGSQLNNKERVESENEYISSGQPTHFPQSGTANTGHND